MLPQLYGNLNRVSWGPFLETPDNFPGPKTILGAQYSPIAIQFLLMLKAKFREAYRYVCANNYH